MVIMLRQHCWRVSSIPNLLHLHFFSIEMKLLAANMCTSCSWRLWFLTTMMLCSGVLVGSISAPTQFSTGSPWPLPASMTTTSDFQPINAVLFHFNVTRYSCDILEVAFIRYFDIIFHGQPYHEKYRGVHISKMEMYNEQQLLFKPKVAGDGLKSLDVAVQQKCEEWPSLEMDESCELSLYSILVRIGHVTK